MTLLTLSFLTFCAFVTATISAISGMGGGILLLSVLVLFLPFNIVIPIHGVVQLVSNFTRSFFLRKHIRFRIFLFYSLGLPAGAFVSTLFLKRLENPNIPRLLIAFIILYVLFKPKKLPAIVLPHWAFAFVGFFAGALSLLVGAVGPFIAPFFLRGDFKKEEIIATKASVQTVTHLLKIPAFLYLGFSYLEYLPTYTMLLVATIIGTRFGVHILGKINENIFRILFKTALFFAALRIFYSIYGGAASP